MPDFPPITAIQVEQPDKYIVRKNGSVFEWIDGSTQEVLFSHAYAHTVINAMLSNLGNEALVPCSVRCKGEIPIYGAITFDRKYNLTFVFDQFVFLNTYAQIVIQNKFNRIPLKIRGLRILVMVDPYETDAIKVVDAIGIDIDIGSIENDLDTTPPWKGNGILYLSTVDSGIMDVNINVGIISGFECDIKIKATEGFGFISVCKIRVGFFGACVYGLKIEGTTDSCRIFDMTFDVRFSSCGEPTVVTDFGIYITGKVNEMTFWDYQAWEIGNTKGLQDISYYADEYVLNTRFVGGMAVPNDPTSWIDNGKNTQIVGIAVPNQCLINRFMSLDKILDVPLMGWEIESIVGSGEIEQRPTYLNVWTGTTQDSLALVANYVRHLSRGYWLSFDRYLVFTVDVLRDGQVDDNLIARIQIKQAFTEGILADKGIGLEVANQSVLGESFGTERKTVALGTLGGWLTRYMIVIEPNKRVMFFVNGTKVGEITGTGVPTGSVSNIPYIVVSTKNPSTTKDISLSVGYMGVYIERMYAYG